MAVNRTVTTSLALINASAIKDMLSVLMRDLAKVCTILCS